MDRVEPRSSDEDVDDIADWIDGDDEIVTVGGPLPHVIHVEAVGPLVLHVRFDDGVEGTVRFCESSLCGVFAKLRDTAYFQRVGILYGAVSWPDEDPDMAPDRMHDELIAGNGKWVVQ